MKLQDLLSVLKDNPKIFIYIYPHGYAFSESAIFRGPLTQLPYKKVESFLNHDVKRVVPIEDSLEITLED